jgi:hypothetical protein
MTGIVAGVGIGAPTRRTATSASRPRWPGRGLRRLALPGVGGRQPHELLAVHVVGLVHRDAAFALAQAKVWLSYIARLLRDSGTR